MSEYGDDLIAGWRKSSASDAGACVEVRFVAERVHVRDTKDRNGAFLTFTHREWHAFLAGVRRGEFDVSARASAPS